MKTRSLVVCLFAVSVVGCAPEKPAETEKKPLDFKSSFEGGRVKVLMKTSKGEITLELDGEKAPITVDNFLKYAESGYYKGTVFHRVIRNSMIQGGSYLPNLGQKEGLFTPIKSESTNGLKNVKGSIAMARLPGTDTSTSQFFINVNNNGVWDYLDEKRPGYAVFGKVIGGLLTVDAIRNGRTSNRGGFEDVPDDPVVIEDVTRIE